MAKCNFAGKVRSQVQLGNEETDVIGAITVDLPSESRQASTNYMKDRHSFWITPVVALALVGFIGLPLAPLNAKDVSPTPSASPAASATPAKKTSQEYKGAVISVDKTASTFQIGKKSFVLFTFCQRPRFSTATVMHRPSLKTLWWARRFAVRCTQPPMAIWKRRR